MGKSARISLVNLNRIPKLSSNWEKQIVELIGNHIKLSAHLKNDLVAFPENCNNSSEKEFEHFEKLDGFIISKIAECARKNNIYVVLPVLTIENGVRYNSSILINRRGIIEGIYHKNFPTFEELKHGILPGKIVPVFKTDFGRLGLCICFDLNFWEVGSALAKKGAELIIWSSMWPGGRMLSRWAIEFGFSVAAVCSKESNFVDVAGRELKSVQNYLNKEAGFSPIKYSKINLDQRLLHQDNNIDLLNQLYKKYGQEAFSIEFIDDECLIVFASNLQNISSDNLMKEFGLKTMQEYLNEVRLERKKIIKE